MPPEKLFRTMDALHLMNTADLRFELQTSQVVHSVQIINRDTDTEMWLVAYRNEIESNSSRKIESNSSSSDGGGGRSGMSSSRRGAMGRGTREALATHLLDPASAGKAPSDDELKPLWDSFATTTPQGVGGGAKTNGPKDDLLHIVLGFRGSSSLKDAITNLKYNKVSINDSGPLATDFARWIDEFTIQDPRVLEQVRCIAVHMGFWGQYNSLRKAVATEVSKVLAKSHGQYEIMVAGHSMGGALASICAFDLLGHGIAIKGRTTLLTIGAGCASS